jgi:hypothetical protein
VFVLQRVCLDEMHFHFEGESGIDERRQEECVSGQTKSVRHKSERYEICVNNSSNITTLQLPLLQSPLLYSIIFF